MSEEDVSALVPVHAGIEPGHFREAVEGILQQTRTLDEIVVVQDGPLLPDHYEVLADLRSRHDAVVDVVLPQNLGAGFANQAGLEVATSTWIAKFDADDICLPQRVARALELLGATGADVCGSAMFEFVDDPATPTSVRRAPLTHEDIGRKMRFNNPMNHPTTVYRRDLAVSVGGYSGMRFMQDYDLFARMYSQGARMVNDDEPLVLFRSGRSMRRRRHGREILCLEWELQRRLRGYGLIGWARTIRNMSVRVAFRLLPDGASRLIYGHVLSRPVVADASQSQESP